MGLAAGRVRTHARVAGWPDAVGGAPEGASAYGMMRGAYMDDFFDDFMDFDMPMWSSDFGVVMIQPTVETGVG